LDFCGDILGKIGSGNDNCYFDKSAKHGDEGRISKWTLTTWRRASTGMRYALLNPILDELVREGQTFGLEPADDREWQRVIHWKLGEEP
jgi:hypothetical protein